LLGRVIHAESAGFQHALCDACGALHALGTPCPYCAEFESENGCQSIHSCGGCGAGFLVSPRVSLEPAVVDGTERVFCACCHDFLGDRLRSSNMAHRLGYDMEGHAINIWFPNLTPTEKRRRRDQRTQAHMVNVLRVRSSRFQIQQPLPLFLTT
jgi:hypothetical protein